MNRLILASAALVCLCASSVSRADLAIPPRGGVTLNRAPIKAKLEVVVDKNIKQPELRIPHTLILRGPARGPGQPPRRGGNPFGLNTVPMVVGGVALTLAFVSGGFWLVRRSSGKIVSLLIGLSFVTLASTPLWADVPSPFPRPKPRPNPVPQNVVELPANVTLPENVTLRIVPRGNKITLVVPGKRIRGNPVLPGVGAPPPAPGTPAPPAIPDGAAPALPTKPAKPGS